MNEPLHIAALIMAAGASRRMNGIKQVLPWKESNFLLETLKTVTRTKATKIEIILGANADNIMDTCRLKESKVPISINPNWSQGLGNSIAFGTDMLLKNTNKPDGILICLADQPLLTTSYLNLLIDTFSSDRSKIVATKYGFKAGVPAVFPNLFFKELRQLQGDQGAKEMMQRNSNRMTILDAQHQVTDIDTLPEYERLLKEHNAYDI
ncbi:MAG: nucleotidyltransferase family protein [Maribacter sp.]